jgi:hypothetical protein
MTPLNEEICDGSEIALANELRKYRGDGWRLLRLVEDVEDLATQRQPQMCLSAQITINESLRTFRALAQYFIEHSGR